MPFIEKSGNFVKRTGDVLLGGLVLADYSTIETPEEGMVAYDYTNHNVVFYDGTEWKTIAVVV